MVSNRCPKRAKMEPAAKVMHSKLQNDTKSRQGVVFANVPRPFWSFPGTQRDSENPSRIDFSLKSVLQTCFFVDFRADNRFTRFFHDFASIFHEKSMKNWWKNKAFFHSIACFFEHGDPHETSYFTIRKLFFHFSYFCFFVLKNRQKMKKNQATIFACKND